MDYDIIIKNGKIINGTGNPWFMADIGIRNGRIDKIGRIKQGEAERIIDVKGLLVCPGFIDAHSHSDFTIFFNNRVESAIRQGITTMITGQCGSSLAPVNPARMSTLLEHVSPSIPPGEKLNLDWTTFRGYLDRLEEVGCSSNLATLVGHGSVRIAVMGMEARPPTYEELGIMKMLVAEAMEAGAFGMSTGLIYPPGIFSTTDEIVELCRVVAKYDGVYVSHIRGEGENLLDAVWEAIVIGERAMVPVQISHHKASGRKVWGKTEETLKLMEEARVRGVEVTCDQYPYIAGSTSLVTVLPPWAHEGGIERLLSRLRDPETREKIRYDIEHGLPGWHNLILSYGWENIVISSVKSEKNKIIEGKNLVEAMRLKDKPDEFTTLFDLLLEENGEATIITFSMNEDDVRRVMKHPLQMVGTDSSSVAPYGPLARGKPHPRAYGTIPRILGKYVREEGALSIEDAIRKMTSFPAQKFKLKGRGLIMEGFWADIVVLDPDKVIDKATFQEPHQYPEGVEYVIVNGEVIVERGEHTGRLAGKVLRHSGKQGSFR
ncbi:MAG: D-aminoacylase [Thermoproteota archaeon]